MPVVGSTCVIDLYHLDEVQDWVQVKADGIAGVLHKATEGLGFQDNEYPARRIAAKQNGLLWGSYHYASGDDGAKQADYYLAYATPAADEIMCLDVEPSTQHAGKPHMPDMTYDQLVAFVQRVSDSTGRLPMIYGGASLLGALMTGRQDSIVNLCALWYADYPHAVNGIVACDRDTFNGTPDQLRAQWPFVRKLPASPASS
jgi:lysozyme